ISLGNNPSQNPSSVSVVEDADTKPGLWHALPSGKRAITVVGKAIFMAFAGLPSHPPSRGASGGRGGGRKSGRGQGFKATGQAGHSNSATHDDYVLQNHAYVQGMTSPESELTFHNFQISDGTTWYPMKFMVDSGATTSLMSGASYDRWVGHITLHPPDKKVYAVDGRLVKDIRRYFQTKISFGARVHLDRLYVSENRNQDLL
ncbi:MAG: retroviral-like aspartic protease, partial [Gammaproteobacteria bacterium]|nr:retroviral-like aspartic protease [Gammaproteobacteria bacterium]